MIAIQIFALIGMVTISITGAYVFVWLYTKIICRLHYLLLEFFYNSQNKCPNKREHPKQ